ncbi:hypothetical protein EW026_g3266 [Hermanssonia centrifuga]|uniref:L domain-like protein n=1 Tax=Hermanssonia centrifuga TaxID=98765 RepID=A0A4V3XAQ1_9APHY|nr:hypothetical protein EW026_g3266 [Hermanssonia centrifuga]
MKSLKPPTSPQKLRSPVRKAAKLVVEEDPAPKTPAISLKEQIALRRAEAKKAAMKSATPQPSDFEGLEEAAPTKESSEDAIDLGRWSVKETIERARSTGAINLASRALPCLPSALFDIHLGITPEPLKLVPVEPPITTATSDDFSAASRKKEASSGPSWYEAQDLAVLKAWNNEIVEIQSEISMFGSLNTIDLHNNKLTSLPDTFADLTALTSLDLSHNELDSLPTNFWALPNLATLNLSHNQLTSLPFSAPFANVQPIARTKDPRGDWFSVSITRATSPLPKLSTVNVSHNKLKASGIDCKGLPEGLAKLDLSENPLGWCIELLRALAKLKRLTEVKCERADIGDDSFPVDLFTSSDSPFLALSVLDLGETQATRPVMEACLRPGIVKQTLEFDVTQGAPKAGSLRVVLGKRYYDAKTQTLTLPPSVAPSKAQHMRSFSLAPKLSSLALSENGDKADMALAIPTPTLPLCAIFTQPQPFAQTLKTLILTNRKMDPSFSLPVQAVLEENQHELLPCLEELSFEGCNLSENIAVSRSQDPGGNDVALPRMTERLLPLLAKLFPSLRTLDLSFNALTGAALDKDTLASLILSSDPLETSTSEQRKGLRHLRLRGNRITELEGFQGVAELFKGNRDVPSWKLEELDLRDNEIGRLPPEVGLLPLDVFLVDGNV